MKILILSALFPPQIYGGGEIAAYNMAKLLVKLGHEVSVGTIREKNATPKWGEMAPEGFKIYYVETSRSYTLFTRTKVSPLQKMKWHLQDYIDPRNIKFIKLLLDEVQPDQIDIHNIIGFGFNILKEIGHRDIPVNFITHGLDLVCFHASMFRKGKNCKKQCTLCKAVGAMRQNALAQVPRLGFISPSRANIEKIIPLAPVVAKSKYAVIRNVPDDLPALPQRTASPVIRLLYVGRLNPVKGVDFLLKVLDHLSNSYLFHLNILGTGPSEEELRAQYESKSWVTFKGFVAPVEVPIAMAESDLFCMTSLWAEPYGLVTAQALQIGTPVIGSSIGGTIELVRNGETGILVEPGNENEWIDAFKKIFDDPSLLEKWKKNTEKYKYEFDENLIGQSYNKFSEQIINK